MSGSNTSVNWRPDPAAIAQHLKPVLDELEALRRHALVKRGNARTAASITFALGTLIALALFAVRNENALLSLIIFAASALIALLVHHLVKGDAIPRYLHQFKSIAFRHATRLVAPGIEYSPQSMIPMASFQQGALFNSRIDRYHGEDCFHGKAGQTNILLSELHVQRKDTSTDSKGRTKTTWVTVFQGIYLIADFHKHFNGHVRIEPDVAEATFGWLGRKLQGFSGDLVRLENPDFERAFKVRASDPVEARYLLTPDMQERFLELRNRWSPGIHAALTGSSLHLAIPNRQNWFEPDINTPASHTQQLNDFLQQLVLLLHITEQLDLNTRIWTKN
jgi:hypothetical protein